MPKKFTFGDEKEVVETPPPVLRKPREFSFPLPSTEKPSHTPHVIAPKSAGEAVHQRRQHERTLTDVLINKARQQSPDVSMEIRGRIDMLLKMTTTETLVEWGNCNLAPLQQASNIQAEIATELRRINAIAILTEAKDAACRPPSFMDRFSVKKPDHYEARLTICRNDLVTLMVKSENLRKSYAPEVGDLHLDALSLVVVHQEWSDCVMMQLGNSRSKTLIQAHQTGMMLLQTLMNTVQQCGQIIEQIDGMLTTTIPQWKLSQGH